MSRIVAVTILGATLAACGSPSSPPATGGDGGGAFMGTVAGKPFTPVDAIALKGVYDPAYPGIVTVVLGNMPNLCALFQQLEGLPGDHAAKANFVDVGFTLGQTSSTSTVGTGTYTASGNPNELDSAGWIPTTARATRRTPAERPPRRSR